MRCHDSNRHINSWSIQEGFGKGRPSHTHIVAIVASVVGLDYLRKNVSSSEVSIWLGAVDDEITAQALIVPGLGDAGNLAYGDK